MVQLNDRQPRSAEVAAANAILEGSPGIWAQKAGKAVLVNQFGLLNPLFFAFGTQTDPDLNLVDPNQVAFEFQLSEMAKVAEVRLSWQRMVIIIDIQKGDTPGEMHKMLWDGEVIPIAAGSATSKREIFETLTAGANEIFYGENRRGQPIVRVHFRAPFIAAGPLRSPTEGHSSNMITPVAMEVVLGDGRTLSQSFGGTLDPDFCEKDLSKHIHLNMKSTGSFRPH